MAKLKQKTREEDEVERLQKEVRELKASNRSLLKRLKKIDREYAKQFEEENHQRALEDDFVVTTQKNQKCKHCERGEILTVDLLGRKFERCSVCDFRQKKS